MKIAIFHNLPSGGAKRSLYGFVKNLAELKHNIQLFTVSTADENFLDLRPFVSKTTVLPVKRTFAGSIRSMSYVLPLRFSACDLMAAQKKLAESINSQDFDVVLVEQDRFTMSPFLLQFLSTPHVYYCQQPARHHERMQASSGLVRQNVLLRLWRQYLTARMPFIDRENAATAKYILANSNFSREAIRRAYARDASVCYLGVDTSLFRRVTSSKSDFVLSVGSLEPLKGHDFVVRALSRIPRAHRPPFTIVANAGYSSYRNAIERLAADKEVQLRILTMVNDEELVHHYNEAQLLVYAPHLEPFGLAVLEAMACGTPVVAIQEGGIRESVIPNETGLLVEREEENFANAVYGLLQDRVLAERLAQNAGQKIADFWTVRHATERLLHHLSAAASGTVVT